MTLEVIKTDGGILKLEPGDANALDGLGVAFSEDDCPTEDELVARCSNAAALLVLREPITARVLDAMPHCKVVARFGVGVDSIDLAAAQERGVVVTNVPDANIGEVAAHALAMILSLTRRLPVLDQSIRAGTWSYLDAGNGMRRLDSLLLGLVGCGQIGRKVARSATALGFRVAVFDPAVPESAVRNLGAEPMSFDELLGRADIISLHVPLTAETRRMIDQSALERMKPTSFIVNTSRGGLIDEDALAAAIENGDLAGAALDVFEQEPLPMTSPLRTTPRVILTPHAAHYAAESYRETIEKAFAEVARVLRGERPHYRVV